MKMICFVVAAIIVCALGSPTLSAQSPDKQFGVGVVGGNSYGAYLAYAITPAVHVGTGLGLRIQSNNNQFYIGPYGKFLFSGTKELKPWIAAQFQMVTDNAVDTDGTTTSSSALVFAGGAEYFITPNFGLVGGINVLNLGFTPSMTQFGLLNGFIAAEWFFE